MLDYFNALGLDRNQSTDEIRKTLIALRKKWVGRAQSGANSENIREAERQLEMIQDALLKFADDASRTSYQFELNNQSENHNSVDTKKPTDEIYKKNLASANAFMKVDEYNNALNLAKNMLSQKDYRTIEVYDVVMYCLYFLKRYDEVLEYGLDAINNEGIVDQRLYRVMCYACEKKGNSALAHQYLLELREARPDDKYVDYLIADVFMKLFNGEFIPEARKYLDTFIKNCKENELPPDAAVLDIRLDFIEHNISLIIPKIAKYLTDMPFFQDILLDRFTKYIEENIIIDFNQFESYIMKDGINDSDINLIVAQSIPVWDIMYTLATAKNLEEQWYKLTEKYTHGSISSVSVSVMERYAKRIARQLPSINQSIQVGRRILTVDNADDYAPLNKLLLTLKNLTAHLVGRSEKFDSLIKEVSYLEDLDTAYYLKNERKRWRLFEIIAGVLLILLGAPLFLNVDTLSSFFRALGSKLTYSADPASAYLAMSMFIEMIIVMTVIRLFSSFWGSSLPTGLKIFLGIIPLPTNITLYGVLGIIVPLGIYEMTYKTDLARTIDNNLKFLGNIYASTVGFMNNIKVPAIIIFLVILVAYFVFVTKVIRRSRFIGKVKPIFGTVIFDWIEH